MKNKGVLVFAGVVAALGGYLAWDISAEKREQQEKQESRKIFGFDPEQVNEFTIEKGGAKVRLSRSVDGWRIEEPVRDNADDTFTDDFVDRAVKDSMVEVAKEGEGIDWKVYGLETPAGRVSFKTQSGQEKTLLISTRQNFEQNAMARLSGENRVLVVPAAWTEHINRKALDFRDKRLYRFKIAGVDRIEFKNAHSSGVLEMKDGQWIIAGHPEWPLEQNRVRELLTMINESRVKDFVSAADPTAAQKKSLGLGAPAAVVQLRAGDKSWSATLGRGSGEEHAAITDPKFVLKLENGTLAKFESIDLLSFRDRRRPFDFNKDLVRRIEVITPLKSSVFVRKDAGWDLEKPVDGHEVDSGKVGAVVSSLREMNAATFADGGLSRRHVGRNRIRLLDEKGDLVFEMTFDPATQGRLDGQKTSVVTARTSSEKDVVLLEPSQIESLSLATLVKPKASASGEAPPKGN